MKDTSTYSVCEILYKPAGMIPFLHCGYLYTITPPYNVLQETIEKYVVTKCTLLPFESIPISTTNW